RQGGPQRPSAAKRNALEARRRQQRVRATIAVLIVLAIAGAGIGVVTSRSSSSTSAGGTPELKLGSLASLGTLQPTGSPGPAGPEGVPVPQAPVLADTGSIASGQTVDGIQCQVSEQVVFHIHVHVTVFLNGAQRQIPYGIGIPGARAQNTRQGPFVNGGTCLYWLHTHAPDGIIHVESPVQRTYTLGDFFDIWGQPLGPSQVGPSTGVVTVLYNGRPYEGNPRNIPLKAHAQIQVEVGTPLTAPVSVGFPNGL
ncbi:MAG: hypothetical protein ACRDU0_17010, partial [Mycobacterium sp.]